MYFNSRTILQDCNRRSRGDVWILQHTKCLHELKYT